MKKIALFVACFVLFGLSLPSSQALAQTPIFLGDMEESFEDDGWAVNDYQTQSSQYVTIERVFDSQFGSYVSKNTFHNYCNDSYFGLRETRNWTSNRIHWRAKIRFGDDANPYTWITVPNSDSGCGGITSARTHELKFPDIGGGQTPNDRIIGKFRSNGSFHIYAERGTRINETSKHSVPNFRFESGEIHTIEFMVEDNGANGDIVRIWIDNNNEGSPDYEYVSTGDLIGSAEWLAQSSLRFDHGYRNHNPAEDQTFYFDDVAIDNQFIGTRGDGSQSSESPTEPAPTITFTASPVSIDSGESTTLSWSSTNSASCSGTNFNTANQTSGSVLVSPTADTTYTLTCTGTGGTEIDTVNIEVTNNATEQNDSVSCDSFTYSSWGSCSSNGTQTRNILSSSPANCEGGIPITTQSCLYSESSESNESDTGSSGGGGNKKDASDEKDREALLARISELTKLIATLKAQLTNQNDYSVGYFFTKNLKSKDENTDVQRLQKKLNRLGFVVAEEGAGSPGFETNYYGSRTIKAIERFQCQYNIVCSGTPETTGYGNFGPLTREKLNAI